MIDQEKMIKLALTILLFLCLLEMPYGYYQLVRFFALIGFAILAYKSYDRQEHTLMIVYAGLAILFQPLMKISLGRELWNIIDVIVGTGLIISIIFESRLKRTRSADPQKMSEKQ